ncbi:MAG: glycoside hydrolase family 38 C-terminal domain-containing protein, partial [Bacteroidota bacterium]
MAIELLDQILGHVRDAIFPRRFPLLDWRMKEGTIPGAERSDFKEKGWADIRVPFEWGRFDRTVWFRSSVAAPEVSVGKSLGLRLSFPEGQLYLNGEPHHGLDSNHCDVFLTDKARRNQRFQLAVEAYGGRSDKHHQFSTAELVEIDPTARTLYYGLRLLQELTKTLDHNSQELAQVRELIRRTLIFLKYFAPEGEEYPNAIARALTFLRSALGTEFQTTIPGLVHLVGQSHIDVVWLWKIAETERKNGRTFSTALRMLEQYPEFSYAQSQALLYHQTKQRFPGLYRSIKSQIAAGRWEPVGALWVEPDCNIPSGESLVRQVLHGTRFYQEEFGRSSEILWLPDTFGYTWSLPQILKKSGINYFFTTKLRWNDTTAFPHTSFWWQGIDGSRVLSHIPPLGLEAQITPKDLRKTAKFFGDDEQPLPLMQTFGFGDGGGGPTVEHVETARFLGAMPGLPAARLSTPTAFFKDLESREPDLPVWDKELYLQKHRGTFTTHGHVKQANRAAERALYIAELLASLRTVLPRVKPAPYPVRELDGSWKTLLTNQFHDIIPGTSIKDAMDEAKADLASVRTAADAIAAKALGALLLKPAAKGPAHWTAFNPLAFERPVYAEVEVAGSNTHWMAEDQDGAGLTTQVVEHTKGHTKLLVFVPAIPPLGFRSFVVRPGQIAPAIDQAQWRFAVRTAETPRLRIRFDNKGGLSSIYDKSTRREYVQKGKRANAFMTFRDTPKEWEAWDIEGDFDRHRTDLFAFRGSKVIEQGPLRATLRQEYRTENGSVLTQLIRLYHESPRIDFETSVRWKEHHTLLKVAFPLGTRVTTATYEIQFGAVERSTRSKEPADKAKFEVPAQQWAAVGDGKIGGALLNDSKYGYDCRDNNLRLTLLRSPRYPHPIEPIHQTAPEFTDVGDHHFTYAYFPYTGDWRSAGVVGEARSFNVPALIVPGTPVRAFPSLLTISRPNIAVSSIKQAEDGNGLVVRFYEATGVSTDTTVSLGRTPSAASEN